jgi:hypothetical protein
MSVVVQLETWFLLIYVINLSKNQFRDILFKLLHVALLLEWQAHRKSRVYCHYVCRIYCLQSIYLFSSIRSSLIEIILPFGQCGFANFDDIKFL